MSIELDEKDKQEGKQKLKLRQQAHRIVDGTLSLKSPSVIRGPRSVSDASFALWHAMAWTAKANDLSVADGIDQAFRAWLKKIWAKNK